MDFKTAAVEYFDNGFNCAQSVVTSFKNELEISEKDLLKISSGFGAGMGRLQNTCGAASGAFMVIGLKFGNYRENDKEAKERIYSLIREFESEFRKIHQFSTCRELLGCDFSTEEGKEYYNDNNLKETVCIKCIEDSIDILNKLI